MQRKPVLIISCMYHITVCIYLYLQIHTFTRACNSNVNLATCNCGVAIKSDDDVILFDRCDRDALDIGIFLNGELTPGTHIFRRGVNYVVSACYFQHLEINIIYF